MEVMPCSSYKNLNHRNIESLFYIANKSKKLSTPMENKLFTMLLLEMGTSFYLGVAMSRSFFG